MHEWPMRTGGAGPSAAGLTTSTMGVPSSSSSPAWDGVCVWGEGYSSKHFTSMHARMPSGHRHILLDLSIPISKHVPLNSTTSMSSVARPSRMPPSTSSRRTPPSEGSGSGVSVQ